MDSVKSYLFISDVHLGAFSQKKNRRLEEELVKLVTFCEKNALKIIILGDFFDYWMEYTGKHPLLGQHVLNRFESFHRNTDSQTLYVTGNHDNWTHSYLECIGFDIEHEYRIIGNAKNKIMVLHGDGLSDPELNLPRTFINRVLRNSYFVSLYQTLIPPFIGWRVMKIFSQFKRWMDSRSQSRKQRELLNSWANNVLQSNESIEAIVYGHHHHSGLRKINGKICMNCGYFGRNKTVGLYTNNIYQLVTWNADENMLMSDINCDFWDKA